MSGNLETAVALARTGLAVFPCQSGGERAKQPMPFLRWREASTTDEQQIAAWWRKWPDAAPALDLAKCGLIVIDADRHDLDHDGVEAFGALMAANGFDPDSAPIVATPSQGNHHFFRQPAGRAFGNGRGNLPAGVDVRGHGGYVIAPGTVMADGRVYELHGNLDEAPELPDWLIALLEARHGGDRPTAPVQAREAAGADEIAELLSHVPADCGYHDWVAALMAVHAATGGDGFDIADRWSATGGRKYCGSRELARKWRSFRRQGITIATLADLARRHGADLAAIALKYNRPQGYDPVEAAEAARRLIQHHDGSLTDAKTGESVVFEVNTRSNTQSTASPPVTNYPAGLVGDIARWIVATARRPQPELSIGAALAIVGTAAGRHIMGPTETGTALYILALAPTGKGKDAPVRACMRILSAAGMDMHIGPDEWMSMSAVIDMLEKKPLALCPQDEFGSFMQRVFSKKGNTHERAIPKILRGLWGVNFGPFNSPQWANTRRGGNFVVKAPCISIFAASTHEQFYSAMEGAAIADGTLNRFLVIEGDRNPAFSGSRTSLDANMVPAGIVDGLKRIYMMNGILASSQLNDINYDLAADGRVTRLNWCPDGSEAAWEAFQGEIDARMTRQPLKADFIVRAPEMVARIATIIAVGRGNDGVRIDDIEYAIGMVRRSLDHLLAGADEYMTENEQEANVKKVLRLIRRVGRIPHGELLCQVRHIRARDLRDIIASLIDEGSIKRVEIDTKGRKRFEYLAK